MPVRCLLRIVADALRGLHAAHELTGLDGAALLVVHRDATPQNILVGADGSVKVTDFGIARAEQRSVMTEAGQAKGKFAYMAPEQCAGGLMDRRVDIFAMGIVLWELLTGRPMFHGENDAVIISQITAGKYPRPSELKPEIPSQLDSLVMTAVSLHPDDRFPTAAAFADALEAYARDSVGLADQAELAALVMGVAGGVIRTRRQHVQDVIAGRRPSVRWGAPTPPAASSSSSSRQLVHGAMTLDSHAGPFDGSVPATGFGRTTSRRALAVWVGGSAVLSSLVVAVLFAAIRAPDQRPDAPRAEVSSPVAVSLPDFSSAPALPAVVHVTIDADDEIVEIRVPDGNDVEIAGKTATFTAKRGTKPIAVFIKLRDGSSMDEAVVPNANSVIKVRGAAKGGTPRVGAPIVGPAATGGGLKYESNPYE